MSLLEINKRSSDLATTGCCLSFDQAANYAKAQRKEVCVDLRSGRETEVIRLARTVGKGGFVYGFDILERLIIKAIRIAHNPGVTNGNFVKSTLEKIKQLDDAGFLTVSILAKSARILKGKVNVVHWTIAGKKPLGEGSKYNFG